MPINLKGRHFLTLKDFSPEEIGYMLELSRTSKLRSVKGLEHSCLQAKISA